MRVGVVGCGGMGRHHLGVLNRLPNFEIAAVCDISPKAAQNAAESFQAKPYADAGDMCDSESLDLVSVATQTRGHLEPSLAALTRGVSVLCEKPIAIDLAEADAMVEAAEKSGAKLAVHQQNHVHPGIRKGLELVESGAIGEIVVVRGRNKGGRKSGNEFMEMGTHIADMMMRFGGEPRWCAGVVMYENRLAQPQDVMEAKEMSPRDRDSGLVLGARAAADYEFDNGILGEIRFTDYAKTNNHNYGVDIFGSTGQLAVRTSGDLSESLWRLPRPMDGRPSELGSWERVELPNPRNPIETMYLEYAEALERGTDPPCNGVRGRWALEMIMAIYASHMEEGRRVPLPLEERRHPLEKWRPAQ